MKPGTPIKIAGIAVNAFLVLVLLAQAFFLLAPRLTEAKFLTVIGGSMSPAIPLGAVLAVRPVDGTDIRVGDIIAYNSSDSAAPPLRIVHRVVAIETDAEGSLNFITKGDASGSEDIDVVSAGRVIGRSWFHIPLLGYLWTYVRTPWLFILLVAIPGIALIALEGAGLIAYIRRRRGPVPFPAQLGIAAMPLARETPAGKAISPAGVRGGLLPHPRQKPAAPPQSRARPRAREAQPRTSTHPPVTVQKGGAPGRASPRPKGRDTSSPRAAGRITVVQPKAVGPAQRKPNRKRQGASPRATVRLTIGPPRGKALPQGKPGSKKGRASPRATVRLPVIRKKPKAVPENRPRTKRRGASPRATVRLTLIPRAAALPQRNPSPKERRALPRATLRLPRIGKRP